VNREWQEFNELTEDIRADRGRKWVPEGKTDLSIPDPQMRGLFIRVYNSGEGSWIIRYKLFGRSKKFVIGDVKLVGRAKAIKIAKKILSRIELERADPIAAKKERMRANKVTFATQAPLFLEDNKKQGLRPRTILNRQIYLITGYHFKPLHNLPLDEVTSEQVQTQLDVIAAQSGGPSAWLCYGVLNVFMGDHDQKTPSRPSESDGQCRGAAEGRDARTRLG
jgi:hypothetical protein